MKSLLKIAFSLFAGLCMFAACNDSDDENVTGFKLDANELTLGAEGGTQIVNISSGTKWVAKADQPWVQVLPANGIGSVECKIVVDSTLRNDIRKATVTFVPEGAIAQKLEVNQTGFGKMIGLSVKEVTVKSMAELKKRYFEVSVTTNIDFDVEISTDAEKQDWITKPKYSVDLNYGARPRTTKLRFEWAMNTDPEERLAEILFKPKKKEDEAAKEVQMKITQEAAPFIGDNRAGDSLALIIIQEKVNGMARWDASERMEYWANVTLWEKKDKEAIANPAIVGRVRSASVMMINTKETIPDEVAKLTYIEKLTFRSNDNTLFLNDLSIGQAVCKLKHLKSLGVYAYGIETLPEEFKNLGNTLESLDLSSNNFETIPAILKKENFPKLKSLSLAACRRYSSNANLQTETRPKPGLMLDASNNESFKQLLKWDTLEKLELTYNLFYGSLPAMMDVPRYTDADIAANDTLKTAAAKLKTIPKVLPNLRTFKINLNYLSGAIPNWILYHPRLSSWEPHTFIFTQENTSYDKYGKIPGFTNEPASLDYYYELFPLRKPIYNEEN